MKTGRFKQTNSTASEIVINGKICSISRETTGGHSVIYPQIMNCAFTSNSAVILHKLYFGSICFCMKKTNRV